MRKGENTLNSSLTPRLWSPDVTSCDTWLPSSFTSLPAVWLIHRRLASHVTADLFPLISPEERERFSRLHRQEDRDCFLLGRGVLRLLLARHLGLPPAAIRLAYTPYGKPFLDPACANSLLQFTISHSGDIVLLGFHSSRPVGIDLERHEADFEWQPIARQFFPRNVFEEIAGLNQIEKLPAFYKHWCRLEAALKAQGVGFSAAPDTSSHPLAMEGRELYDLLLPQDYSGSIVVI